MKIHLAVIELENVLESRETNSKINRLIFETEQYKNRPVRTVIWYRIAETAKLQSNLKLKFFAFRLRIGSLACVLSELTSGTMDLAS
jgi:hypothetical protein